MRLRFRTFISFRLGLQKSVQDIRGVYKHYNERYNEISGIIKEEGLLQ